VVAVDPKTRSGKPSCSSEPLATLEQTRNGRTCGFDREDWSETPFFAWNVVSDPEKNGAIVRVGDVVEVAAFRRFKDTDRE
jgi:hypothetical protein